jgi:P27 family predicted phage terminase small subunit
MKGRKPKPMRLRLLEGNPSKRPLNEHEPPIIPGRPEPPDYMTDEARDEWRRMCDRLEGMGILSLADWPLLVLWCDTWLRYIEAEHKLQRMGALITTPNGSIQNNPVYCQRNEFARQLTKMAAEFGLGAANRSRMKVSQPQGDQLDVFLGAGS